MIIIIICNYYIYFSPELFASQMMAFYDGLLPLNTCGYSLKARTFSYIVLLQ